MDIKEYISSGIIELYAMGLASKEEASIFECVLKNNEEVKQALADVEKTLEQLGQAEAVEPPKELKASIWDKIKEEDALETPLNLKVVKDEAAEPLKSELKEPLTVDLKTNNSFKYIAIAASIFCVLSLLGNYYFMQQQGQIKNDLSALKEQNKATTDAYANLDSKWKMATQPFMKTIYLAGVNKHTDMKAMVYFDQKSNQVYLSLENLPKPPEGQQYQLWAIVDGKPVDAGMYSIDELNTVQKMSVIKNAQAFAITLEKKGGSATPTMENMYVMGAV